MLVLKIRCQDDIRRISLEKDPTFNELVSTLKKLFAIDPNSNEEFVIKYTDEDEDLITIATDTDLGEALRVYYNQKLAMLKLFLTKYLLKEDQMEEKRKRLQTEANSSISTVPQATPPSPVPSTSSSSVPSLPKPSDVDELAKRLEASISPSSPSQQQPPQNDKPVVATEVVPPSTNAISPNNNNNGNNNTTVPVPEVKKDEAPKPEAPKDDAEWIEFKTRTGKTVFLNLKAGSLQKYGLEPFTRVNTRKGAATVFGIDKDRGFLWFQLDKDQGVSFWDDIINYDSLVAKGVTIMDEQQIPSNVTIPSKTATIPEKSKSTPTKPLSPMNNNNFNPTATTSTSPSYTPAKPNNPPAWNPTKAAEFGFVSEEEERQMIERALKESLKTYQNEK